MPEHEAYRPQTEHASEQPQNPSASEIGHAMPRPENEVASNPRIVALMQERDAAERSLQEAILDLETREQSPAFQKAKELLDSGMRLKHISNDESDFYYFGPEGLVTASTYPTEELDSYAYTTFYYDDQHEEGERGNVYDVMGIASREDRDEILKQLSNLTAEGL